MLKQLMALFLLISFGMQTFNKVFIVIDYYINTSAFAADCVNQDKPKMKCHGKCQMVKKIAKETQKDQQYPDRRADNKPEIVLSSRLFFAVDLDVPVIRFEKIYHSSENIKTVKRQTSIFHPPIAC